MALNLKKELGMALGELKSAEWFKELDKETQAIALEQQKEYYTPPSKEPHTLLNLFVSEYCENEWLEYMKENLPWAQTGCEGGDIAWHKRKFATPYILKWKNGELSPKIHPEYKYIEPKGYPIPVFR